MDEFSKWAHGRLQELRTRLLQLSIDQVQEQDIITYDIGFLENPISREFAN